MPRDQRGRVAARHPGSRASAPKWRNRQTRTLQERMGITPVEVRILSSALMQDTSFPFSHTLNFEVQAAPSVMRRKHHALIALRDADGSFILSRKEVYPVGIYRLIGGGVEEDDETSQHAAARELSEETTLTADAADLTPVCRVKAHIFEEKSAETFDFTLDLFEYYLPDDQTLKLRDDELEKVRSFTKADVESLITEYESLPDTVVPDYGFAWGDYGKLFGPVHRFMLDDLL